MLIRLWCRSEVAPILSATFAGIWEAWKSPDGERLQAFATITTEANGRRVGANAA
jgi:putative SOS response-associated peptidase YedK